jgi:phospholipid/cholesterol/gamma-HCH transport system ATP-binding protein
MSCAISNLIIELRNKYKVTSVVVTHDLQSAFSIADKIAMLYRGKIIEVSKPEDFRNSKNPIVRQFVEGSVQGPIKV